MISKTAVVLALVAVAVATPSQPTYGYTPEPTYEEPAKYDFNYAVKDDYSGNDFGHQEARDGYNTQGSYYVLLPDGRLQKVTYTVNGDSGYVAEVSYEGEAQHSEYKPAPTYKPAHPAPAYKPAPAYEPAPAYKPAPAAYKPAPAQACLLPSLLPLTNLPLPTSLLYEPAPAYKPARLRTCPCLQATPAYKPTAYA
nr:cuticle protein 7-like [Penaeus vannamei]